MMLDAAAVVEQQCPRCRTKYLQAIMQIRHWRGNRIGKHGIKAHKRSPCRTVLACVVSIPGDGPEPVFSLDPSQRWSLGLPFSLPISLLYCRRHGMQGFYARLLSNASQVHQRWEPLHFAYPTHRHSSVLIVHPQIQQYRQPKHEPLLGMALLDPHFATTWYTLYLMPSDALPGRSDYLCAPCM